jgi:hypothetical protein
MPADVGSQVTRAKWRNIVKVAPDEASLPGTGAMHLSDCRKFGAGLESDDVGATASEARRDPFVIHGSLVRREPPTTPATKCVWREPTPGIIAERSPSATSAKRSHPGPSHGPHAPRSAAQAEQLDRGPLDVAASSATQPSARVCSGVVDDGSVRHPIIPGTHVRGRQGRGGGRPASPSVGRSALVIRSARSEGPCIAEHRSIWWQR